MKTRNSCVVFYHICRINDVKTQTVDGDDDLRVLVDDEAGQTLGRSLDLSSEECGAVVGQ